MLFDGSIYLDDELLELLAQQAGLVPFVVVQAVGDAVVVPAGCAHQVRNLRSSIKVAADFVAPEHVEQCLWLTSQIRDLPAHHHRHVDVLAVRTILFHATCACLSPSTTQTTRRARATRGGRRTLPPLRRWLRQPPLPPLRPPLRPPPRPLRPTPRPMPAFPPSPPLQRPPPRLRSPALITAAPPPAAAPPAEPPAAEAPIEDAPMPDAPSAEGSEI